jgi:hypothetical protein
MQRQFVAVIPREFKKVRDAAARARKNTAVSDLVAVAASVA